MKRFFTLIFGLLLFHSAQAQITIEANDLAPLGIKAVQTIDTLPDGSITEGGTGFQSWNFTALKDHMDSDLEFVMADETPYYSDFPNANLAVKSDSMGYIYLSLTDQALQLLGSHRSFEIDSATYIEASLRVTPGQSLLRFPATFGDSFEETTLQVVTIPGIVVGFPFDSVRLESTIHRVVNINAYGELTTPLSTYEVIRSSETQISWDTVYILFAGNWQIVDASTEGDTSYNYNFWTNANGLAFPVVQINYEPEFNLYSASWLKSLLTSDKETFKGPSLELFPNPASEYLSVRFEETQKGSIEIFDANGKLVVAQSLEGSEAKVAVSELAVGTHLLVVKDQKGKMLTFRLFQKL